MLNQIKKYWDQKGVVKEFRDMQIQDYWYEFFNSIKSPKDKKALDIGCGGGRYTEMLFKMGFQVCAFDLHKEMVKATKNRVRQLITTNNTKAKILIGDMTKIPFGQDQFDFILSNGVFHNAQNLNDLNTALSEVKRVLKTGGILCLNMFYDGGNNTKISRSGKNLYITQDGTPMTLLKLASLLELFKRYYLEPVSKVIFYTRDMEVGTRDVMRAVFKRTS